MSKSIRIFALQNQMSNLEVKTVILNAGDWFSFDRNVILST